MSIFLILAAAMYATGFIGLTWKYPAIALAVIFGLAPFEQNLTGSESLHIAVSEACLALMACVLIVKLLIARGRFSLGYLGFPIALYLAISLCPSLLTWEDHSPVLSFLQMILYMVLTVIVYSSAVQTETELRWSLYALVASSLFLSFAVVLSGSFYVLGLHKNGLGDSIACGLLICMDLLISGRLRWRERMFTIALCIIQAVGLLFTFSRGSWLGALTGMIVIALVHKKKLALIKISLLMVVILIFAWGFVPSSLRDYAFSFSTERGNISARYESIAFAKNAFQSNPLLGVGLGLRKEYDATNIIMSVLAETGLLGLFAFVFLHYVFYRGVRVLVTQLDEQDPVLFMVSSGSALFSARLAHGMVDHYWTRGALLLAWGGVGMVIAIYHLSNARLNEQQSKEQIT